MTPSGEWLEHTADTGFRVRAAAPAQLFQAAAAMLIFTVLDARAARVDRTIRLEIQAPDREQLLVDFLSEILFLLDGRRLVPVRVRVEECTATSLTAEVEVEDRDDARHPPRLVVKAVTFHQLVVAEEPGGWRAEVFLDI